MAVFLQGPLSMGKLKCNMAASCSVSVLLWIGCWCSFAENPLILHQGSVTKKGTSCSFLLIQFYHPFRLILQQFAIGSLIFFSNDFYFLFISKLSLLPAFSMPYKLSLSSEHGEMSLGTLNPHRWTKGKTLKTFVDAQLFLTLTLTLEAELNGSLLSSFLRLHSPPFLAFQ